jgi:hypothetical protein
MTAQDHSVAVQRAGPHGTILGPALWTFEKALGEALRDPPVVHQNGQVDVNQRVGGREPLPSRGDTAKAIDDPIVSAEEVCVFAQVLLARNLSATRLVLDSIERVQREPGDLRQATGQRRLAAAGIAEHRHLSHTADSVTTFSPPRQ